jgi:2-succinyl-5-enolpyruvyl-6-hydroxy-3-cyclohexene-1-carboxylate synthase
MDYGEWHPGDPIGFGNDIGAPEVPYMSYGPRKREDEVDEEELKKEREERDRRYTSKKISDDAWKLYLEHRYGEALIFINRALEYDGEESNTWNRKGAILDGLNRFEEAIKNYNIAIELEDSEIYKNNKAEVLIEWAYSLKDKREYEKALEKIDNHIESYEPEYSQMAAVKYLEGSLMYAEDSYIHYGNSTAVRLANIYAKHYVYCNRGVNGIEGSLSTAAGFSCVVDENVYCVIGDLSFFYDQNALWNQNLHGNLRILLLNNGKGGIFDMLPGLENSPARDKYVAAEHHATAEGICQQNAVVYRQAKDMTQTQEGIDWLIGTDSGRPLLLEVFL